MVVYSWKADGWGESDDMKAEAGKMVGMERVSYGWVRERSSAGSQNEIEGFRFEGVGYSKEDQGR
jgi:hypothetical protein